jgi:tetratricopeptide (TPR) repeat protein
VQLHLRLADVFVHQLGDPVAAQQELAAARALAPDDPAVHEMTAAILVTSDPAAAITAWREVARLAELRGDHRTCARAWAKLGDLLDDSKNPEGATDASGERPDGGSAAEGAWRRSLELDPLQADAVVGLANAAAKRNDHRVAADLYERLRGLGLAQGIAARHELALARSLVALGRTDDARASLRRAALAGGETGAEAHAMLAEIAGAGRDRTGEPAAPPAQAAAFPPPQAASLVDHEHALAELETAITMLVELAARQPRDADRLYTRAAELAIARAMLFDRARQAVAAEADWQRAYTLARQPAPEIAREAARTLLARSGDDASAERRWIDAVLATRPAPAEQAALLVRRADVRRRERAPDVAAALADLREAGELIELGPSAPIHTRRRAHQLEAELFAQSGDQRSRARALAAVAKLAERAVDRIESEAVASAAWLAAGEPAMALAHGARAYEQLAAPDANADVPAALRREVLVTFGEAAWRQRTWPDAIRAYRDLLEDPGSDAPRVATFRYRLAVAADRTGDPAIALAALRPLIDDPKATRGASPELRAQALRLFADLAERAGDLIAAATALESFTAIGSDGSATARADAVYRAGELFRRAERSDDAIRCLETVLRISDTHLPALDALESAWRERGDLERVAAILGRKVAATARHPTRQKPLLSRLGDLQDQLGRPSVALATHQRALEIDPMWRPSLRYVTLGLRNAGQVVAAASGLAQLAGELPGDHGVDPAIVARERQISAEALAELVATLDDAQLDAVRAVASPALVRAALDNANVGAGLARLRSEASPSPVRLHREDASRSERISAPIDNALALRDAAARARAAGKLDDAFATLETAHQVSPGDPGILRELVEIATQLHDHTAVARHLTTLAQGFTGPRRGDVLLELADTYYDKLDDAGRGREAMRKAADAFGSGSRRDATLRMLATEAGAHLAWDITVEALLSIPLEKRTQADLTSLATALMRTGRDADAMAAIEAATAANRFDDGGELVRQLELEIQRKTELVRTLEDRAALAAGEESVALFEEAQQLRLAIGQPGTRPLRDKAAPATEVPKSDTAPWPARTKTKPGLPSRSVPPAPARARPPVTPPPPLAEPEIAQVVEPAPGAAPMEHDPLARVTTGTTTDSGVATQRGGFSPAGDRHTAPAMTARTGSSQTAPTEDEEPSPAIPPPGSRSPTPRALGRIKLIHRETTRPRVRSRRADPSAPGIPDETTGNRQSVRTAALNAASVDPPTDTAPEPTPDPAVPPAAAGLEVATPSLAPQGLPRTQESPDTSSAKGLVPSVTITGTPDETAFALMLAATSADRDRLFAARRADPDDPSVLLALFAHLGDREPAVRRELLAEVTRTSHGRALAIALHELAMLAREGHDPTRATTLWTQAYEADPSYSPVWMPLADALAASDDTTTARELYETIARSDEYDAHRRAFATDRAEALGRDDAVVSGEIQPRAAPPSVSDIEEARKLAENADWPGAIDAAERAAAAHPKDVATFEVLEAIYYASGNVTAASEAIERQLKLVDDPLRRAALWRRRARMYRDTLGRDAEAYRCLKEAHACAPADPEIAYQLRTAAMVRGEWPLAASLLYREIAAAANPRDRGALHLELALIYEERLDDHVQAQANYEQALAFDPTIPAVKLPLARRYEVIGRLSDAARLYEEAAASARAADRAGLLEAAARCRTTAVEINEPDLAAQLDRAEASGDLDAALDLAHQLWRTDPGHPVAFRVLANMHRASGDLAALTELTRIRVGRAGTPDERANAWLDVARLAEEIGAVDQAARTYDLALIQDPGHISALDARGALAFRLGDFATADLIYRDLGTGESVLGDDELALRRSIIAEKLGRDSEALHLAQVAASLAPGRRDVVMRVQELATRIGELPIALAAARQRLELVPLDDDEAQLATHFALVDLLRETGQLDEAVVQLEKILRDHPMHAGAIEALAHVHTARGDWAAATRHLYQLVPLAPSSGERAERLYQLGEALLVYVGDVDRADDAFLRASDLDPGHVPTLRRLIDVYWRADDPASIVEVATELADKDALVSGPTTESALAHALIAAALVGDAQLAERIQPGLGEAISRQLANALAELADHTGRLQIATASTAVAELARRGLLDLAKLRVAAAGTAAAKFL